MKITETTLPPVKPVRVFTLELSEIELQSIEVALGMTCHYDRVERARLQGVDILDGDAFHELYVAINHALKN